MPHTAGRKLPQRTASLFGPSFSIFHVWQLWPRHSQEYFTMTPDEQKVVNTFMNMLIAEGIVDADEWQWIQSEYFEDWRRGVVGSLHINLEALEIAVLSGSYRGQFYDFIYIYIYI